MNRNAELSLYLAKIETAEGTDAVPTAAADAVAILAPFDPAYSYAFTADRRQTVTGHLNGTAPLPPKGRIVSWQKSNHFRGRTNAITASARLELDAWLRAAGLAATYSGGGGSEQVAYTPATGGVGASFPSFTEYLYEDGMLHRALGCRCDLALSFDAGGPVVVESTSQGLYAGASDVALPGSPAFLASVPPIAEGITLSIDGFATGIIRRFRLALGTAVQRRDGARAPGGVQGFRIENRAITWELVLEEPTIATKDFRALADAGTDIALSWAIGSTPYNRLEFSTTAARLETPTPSSDNGLKILTLAGGCYGPTPFTLTVR